MKFHCFPCKYLVFGIVLLKHVAFDFNGLVLKENLASCAWEVSYYTPS